MSWHENVKDELAPGNAALFCSALFCPVPHTGDPVLTSGRVKGGDAIT